MDKIPQIIEIIEVVPEGVTKPIKCRLSNDTVVVAKYPNNPIGNATIVNEYIGFSLARRIGITVPDFGFCEMSMNVLESLNDIEDLDMSNSGICFCSNLLDKTVPLIMRGCIRNKETEKIILLDHVLNNFDRHFGNFLTDLRTCTLYSIDYSHLFSRGPHPNYDSKYVRLGTDKQRFLYTDILDANKASYNYLKTFEIGVKLQQQRELLYRKMISTFKSKKHTISE